MNPFHNRVNNVLAALLGCAVLVSIVNAEVCPPNFPARDTPAGDFFDNGDGTVSQQSTGLMWQKCVDGVTGVGCTVGTATTRPWPQALGMATGSNLAGYTDWRLPSLRELRSMTNLSCHSPATDPVFGPAPSTPLWSSTTSRTSTGFAWQADLNDGRLLYVQKTNLGTIRLVRQGMDFDAARTLQTITNFAPGTPAVAGVASAVLTATGGGSPNPVVFATTSASSICTVSGNIVSFFAAGTCDLTANQAGNANYWAAPQVTASIVVQRLNQAITNFYPTAAVTLGTAPLALTATPGATGNPLVFTSSTPTVCTLSGATVSFVGLGECEVRINQAGNATYNPAPVVGGMIAVRTSLPALPRSDNDTGATLCYDSAGVGAACTQANSGDTSFAPRQDARYGRDPQASAGLPKIGGGAAGFDFTKIANNGNVLPAGAALGSGPTDWACTRDNVTGLTWEVKTTSGLRAATTKYYWYSTDSTRNAGDVGYSLNGLGNTQDYAMSVNTAGLCGVSDWRLPSANELLSIVHFGAANPAVDVGYFPNIQHGATQIVDDLGYYWTATPFPVDPRVVWGIAFSDGERYPVRKHTGRPPDPFAMGGGFPSVGYAMLVRGTAR